MTGMLEVAERLAPIIRTHGDKTEADRKIVLPVIEAIRKTPLANMMLSKTDGGEETPLAEVLAVYERIAREDAAVSWVLWNSCLVTLFSRFMAPALRREVFTNQKSLFCQSTRPMGTVQATGDKYLVNGQWNLVSGCQHADWAFLACISQQDNANVHDASGMPVICFVTLQKDQFKIIDTWHSSGLRGTGSHDVIVEQAEIPAYRVFQIASNGEPRGTTDRVPIMSAVAAIFAAQVLGVSQVACDHILRRGRAEITPGPMPDMRDRPEALTATASHWAALEAARLGLHAAADNIWKIANSGQKVEEKSISTLYAASMHAMNAAKVAMADLHAVAGTRALYTSSPLERRNRDLQAMLRHIVAQPSMLADVGRSLFGTSPQWPLYTV